LLARAILGVLLGVLAIVVPLLVGIALIYVVGVWAVVTGIAEIITAIRLRANISSEWLLVFAGSLSVVFGLLLWFWPLEAARVIAFVIGVYAIILGAVIATAGVRLRGAADLLAPEYDSEYEGRDEEGSTPKGGSETERRGPARRRGRHRAPRTAGPSRSSPTSGALLWCARHDVRLVCQAESGRRGSLPGSGGPGGKRKSGAACAERAGAEEPTHELGRYRSRPESGPG